MPSSPPNTSRATLVRLFQAAVEMAPIVFLTELRLIFARRRILATNTSPAVIAKAVAYQSEAALSPTSGLWQTKFFYIKKIGIFVVTMAVGAGVLGLDYLSGSDAPLPSRITRISSDNIACI